MSYTMTFPLHRDYQRPAHSSEVLAVFGNVLDASQIVGLHVHQNAVVVRYDLIPAWYFSPMLEHRALTIAAMLRLDYVALRNDETGEARLLDLLNCGKIETPAPVVFSPF